MSIHTTVVLFLTFMLAGCDRASVQPEPSELGLYPWGRQVRTSGGFVLSEPKVTVVLERLAQDVAVALRESDARSAVYRGLHASPYREHKVHFRTFLLSDGKPLLEAAARVRRVTNEAFLRSLDSIVDLEFYMPSTEHWAKWNGDDHLLVGSMLTDDYGELPRIFDLAGDPVPWGRDQPPTIPTLAVVRSETDFSRVPQLTVSDAPRAVMVESGAIMTYAYIPDTKAPTFFDGDPELEIHAFVRDQQGNYIDLQCAGQDQTDPFRYDQNDTYWLGSPVQVIVESGIGTNPVEYAVWEDDIASERCTAGTGRPPYAAFETVQDFNNWGQRQVTIVSLIGGVKTISFANLGIPLSLDYGNGDNDDPVGELQGPINNCWPSTGPASFALYEPSEGHPQNGYLRLDFNFGQRDPVCPSPPPAQLSVEIAGPTQLPPDEFCSWQANVSGGQAATPTSGRVSCQAPALRSRVQQGREVR